jgi:murein DD-endopeptidase MepM/ murein hydrolase activator NlpD
MRAKLLALFIIILALGAAWFTFREHPVVRFFDPTPPEMRISASTRMGEIPVEENLLVGGGGINLKLHLRDPSGTGLDEVVVRLDDGSGQRELVKKSYDDWGIAEDSVDINAPASTLKVRVEAVSLEITAFSKGFANAKTTKTFKVRTDFERPRGEVLTVQHNGRIGGALLVVFRVHTNDTAFAGVRWRAKEYAGYPAETLSPELGAFPGLYAAFFPIEQDFDRARDSLKVVIRDRASNEAVLPFPQVIANFSFRAADMKMSRTFFEGRVAELLPLFAQESGKRIEVPADVSGVSDEELASLFKTVNEDYRAFLEEKLLTVLKQTAPTRYWDQVFIRPLAAAPTASFGERRSYFLNGFTAGRSVHQGIDLAHVAMSPVMAANNGSVIFTGMLGIYGETVIIDHGMGLATLYGHLSSISVGTGDSVQRGQVIGRSGATGLAGGDHLHIEFRLHGVPVYPIEWLDPHWMKDHVTDQLPFVVKQIKNILALSEPPK